MQSVENIWFLYKIYINKNVLISSIYSIHHKTSEQQSPKIQKNLQIIVKVDCFKFYMFICWNRFFHYQSFKLFK